MQAAFCLWLLALIACGPIAPKCNADDECAAEQICQDHACQMVELDAGPAGTPLHDSGTPSADAADGDAAMTPTGPADAGASDGGAQPNFGCDFIDGDTLMAAQVPVVLNVTARYDVAGSEAVPVSVDLVGEDANDGFRHWDFSSAIESDRDWPLRALPLAGFWFAADYPAAAYALALDPQESTYGILEKTADEILMWGVASDDEGRTDIRFTPPIPLLRFPLTRGQSWDVEANAAGTFEHNPFYQADEHWQFEVDAIGTVEVPAGTYPTLRLITQRNIEVPILVPPFRLEYRTWQHSFLSPCLGQVAAIMSQVNAAGPMFDEATEFRRLGLP